MQDVPEKMLLFNDQENELIRKEFTFNNVARLNRNQKLQDLDTSRTWNSELNSEPFTERPIDGLDDENDKNVSTKSIILAPFNSTRSHISDDLHSSMTDLIEDKDIIIRFGQRVKEIDHQYELNNNGELDNGVYNKFVNNSIWNDDDGEKANEELVSSRTEYEEDEMDVQLNSMFNEYPA